MRDPFSPLNVVESVTATANTAGQQAAVISGSTVLDYASLVGRANAVARYLLSCGVKPEDKVGISMARSADFATAALGILMSGAAYVALDPSYPAPRRRLIEEDAELMLVLDHGTHEPAPKFSLLTLSLHTAAALGQTASAELLPKINPQQLAYVVYTSGSTGVPKGVEVTHDNLMHLVRWHNKAFEISSSDRATLLANVGFDAAVWELWPYLSAGATLLVPEPEIVRQPEVLRDFVVKNGVTLMFAPTLLAETLIRLSWPREKHLRSLLTGGDALRLTPPDGLPFALVNNYGPAECTVVSTSGEVKPTGSSSVLPSLGQPIDGAFVSILDDHLHEVPIGTPGEICIGGAGVARGYLRRPELTAQRFVTREDGVRMYRSGDLGSLNVDGSIQFLGRIDQQIKIRGYRIECGEIEAALNGLQVVRTSAVNVRENQDGHVALVAYLALAPDAFISHQALRQSLRAILPDYMVPEQFIRVSDIPLTENGKIDRDQLPAPDASNIIEDLDQTLTPVEMDLMAILKELLDVDHIARDDDFFMLGGHSFIAAQLLARIQDHFGVEIGLRAVFENPTLADMAAQIEKKSESADAAPVHSESRV